MDFNRDCAPRSLLSSRDEKTPGATATIQSNSDDSNTNLVPANRSDDEQRITKLPREARTYGVVELTGGTTLVSSPEDELI